MKAFFILFWGLFVVQLSFAQDTLTLHSLPEAGFFSSGTAVQLQCNKNATIYYTTNGSKPSKNSLRYNGSILIDTTTVIRAIAFSNELTSKVFTGTFLIKEEAVTLPVVSVSIEPGYLFDPVKGLFMKGPNASPTFPHKGANYYSTKEVPCHIEFFETDKKCVFKGNLGFKVFGGMSRIFPQKSFALYARKEYGTKSIKHRIFPDKDLKKYKRVVLRNSGSDFGETHFRDALITSFGKEMGLEVQAYRPSVVFINGKYWGVYNLREKLTKHYLEENFGYDADSVNLVEHHKSIQAGSRKSYDDMRSFMRNNNLASQENFDYVASIMDVENFMEYQIIQIYIDNQDAGGNIKFWQPMAEGGKWRWILFDTDFGLGHYGRDGYKFNSLAFHTKADGPIWPNPPWSTQNLRSLLQNEDFRIKFINRFLDRMNYTLDSTRVIARIDQMAERIKPEMPRHWKRWQLSPARWTTEINRMKEFVRKRPAYMRQFLQEQFPEVGKEVVLSIQTDNGGMVILNDVIDIYSSFQGVYFQKLPVTVKAKAFFGNQFSHWEVDGEKIDNEELALRFSSLKHSLKAVFVKKDHPAARQMIMNEISFGDTLSGDWIEFYNDSNQELNVNGWTLVNGKQKEYVFPDAIIKPKDYLVICKNAEQFKQSFPSCKNFIDGLSFGLSKKKEIIMLYDPKGKPVDSIGYDFSKDTAHHILTLVLRDFNLDNNLIENWVQIQRAGSPASINLEYIKNKEVQDWSTFLHYAKIGGVTTGIFAVIIIAYVLTRKKLKKIE